MRFDRELLKGTAGTMVLALLSDAPGYGYELAQRIKRRTKGICALGEGTLYPLLYNLEGKGWIKGKWERGAGKRRRRVYRLTPTGRRQLVRRSEQWRALVAGMTLALRGV